MIPLRPAPVVAKFQISLKSFLRSKRAGPKLRPTPGKVTKLKVHGQRSQRVDAGGRVLQRVVITQESKTQAVNILSAREIESNCMRGRVVTVLINGIVVAEVVHRLIPVIGKPVEGMRSIRQMPIEFPRSRRIAERR